MSQNMSILDKSILFGLNDPVEQTVKIPTFDELQCLKQVYAKLKLIYKSYVILISNPTPIQLKSLFNLEKQLNDTMELVNLYLSEA